MQLIPICRCASWDEWDWLSDLYEVENVEVLRTHTIDETTGQAIGIGRIGDLAEPMTLSFR